VDESLDMRVEPKFVSTLVGQGDTKAHSGIMVPVLVTGTFSSPKFQPDLKGIIEKQMEKGKLPVPKELLNPQEGQPKPEEMLKGIFKGFTGK
jgi:AsmA protein